MELRSLQQKLIKEPDLNESKDYKQLRALYEQYYKNHGFQPPWIAYMIIENSEVLGTCSFTKAPENNTVEIAYWTFPDHVKKGVASFGCQELIKIAQNENPNIRITAKTSPSKNSSTRILENNGFHYVKVVQDEDIGDAWLWEYK